MTIPPGIKNIIFDLGGVLLNIDSKQTEKELIRLGAENTREIYLNLAKRNIFIDFESGKISPAKFREEIKKFLPDNVTNAELDIAWNAMLLDVPPARYRLLQQLKKQYRLFLLSNTNEIHIKAFSKYMDKTYGENAFAGIFEKEYYSYHIGLRKPDTKIFSLVISENRLIPHETLFTDDSELNVEGAKKSGLRVILMAGKNLEEKINILNR